jgi:hypothetical protein
MPILQRFSDCNPDRRNHMVSKSPNSFLICRQWMFITDKQESSYSSFQPTSISRSNVIHYHSKSVGPGRANFARSDYPLGSRKSN